MKLIIKNEYLSGTIEFLYGLKLKTAKSRHRSRLLNLLKKHEKKVKEERTALLKEFGELDETGELVIDEMGNVKLHDPIGFLEALDTLMAESYIIEGANNVGSLKIMKSVILEFDGELEGSQAEIYEELYTKFSEMESERND